MSVDNRIPSEPYIELNGVTVYTEGVYRHGKSPEITKGTIGEKMMNREYNGLGVANDESIERFNDLIDRLIYYMDEGDSVTITGPEKLKDTYEPGQYFRAEVLGFEYDLVFERDFWHDLDDKTSEYGLEFRIIW